MRERSRRGTALAATVLLLFATAPAHASGLAQLKAFVDGAKTGRTTFRQAVLAKGARAPQVSSGTFTFARPGPVPLVVRDAVRAAHRRRRREALDLRSRPQPGHHAQAGRIAGREPGGAAVRRQCARPKLRCRRCRRERRPGIRQRPPASGRGRCRAGAHRLSRQPAPDNGIARRVRQRDHARRSNRSSATSSSIRRNSCSYRLPAPTSSETSSNRTIRGAGFPCRSSPAVRGPDNR